MYMAPITLFFASTSREARHDPVIARALAEAFALGDQWLRRLPFKKGLNPLSATAGIEDWLLDMMEHDVYDEFWTRSSSGSRVSTSTSTPTSPGCTSQGGTTCTGSPTSRSRRLLHKKTWPRIAGDLGQRDAPAALRYDCDEDACWRWSSRPGRPATPASAPASTAATWSPRAAEALAALERTVDERRAADPGGSYTAAAAGRARRASARRSRRRRRRSPAAAAGESDERAGRGGRRRALPPHRAAGRARPDPGRRLRGAQ